MAGIFGDARRAKKDVLADIVTIKHGYENCIMDASMRKAVLTESEKDVKEDMGAIIEKLQMLLKAIHNNARYEASQVVKKETEKINDEIIFLEEQYKSLEEMEEYVKEKTSNTNMKPLKEGKEKCEYARERLDAHKEGITKKSAKFVLHPMLTQILEQMETFAMGSTMVLPVENSPSENCDDEEDCEENSSLLETMRREPTTDPIKTTFMRSNSSKLIKLPDKKQGPTPSRQSSKLGNSTISKPTTSRQNSKSESTISTPRSSETTEKKSKLIKRSNTNVSVKKEVKEDDMKDRYRAIAGLRATLTERSTSAPLLNLSTRRVSVFEEKKTEDKSPLQIKYRETLQTKKHANGCYITGIATLSNGSVVLCDSVHDSLQLYDPEIQQISEMNCPHPWSVAAVSDTAVAVALHYDHKLILVQAAKTLERINEKDIVLKCNASLVYDVKYYAYRLYTLCIDGDIHILDLKGREYGVIKTRMPTNSLKYFDIDLKKENVFVSGEKGIACLNFQGLPLWNFKTQNKSRFVCTGVLVCKGCLLVCDWENNSLVEIYDDGKSMRTVYSERIEKPVAMCQSENGGDIFLTQGDYDLSEEKARSVKVLQVDLKEN